MTKYDDDEHSKTEKLSDEYGLSGNHKESVTAIVEDQSDIPLEEGSEYEHSDGEKPKSKLLKYSAIGVATVGVVLLGGLGYGFLTEEDAAPPVQQPVKPKGVEQVGELEIVKETIQQDQGMKDVPSTMPSIPEPVSPPKVDIVKEPTLNIDLTPPAPIITENNAGDVFSNIDKVPEVIPPINDDVLVVPQPKIEEQENAVIAPINPVDPINPVLIDPIKEKNDLDGEALLINPTEQASVGNNIGMIEPSINEDVNVEINEDFMNNLNSVSAKMSALSNNVKDLNSNMKTVGDKVELNRKDIDALLKRVDELEKLHKNSDGTMVSCANVCNSDGKVTPLKMDDTKKSAKKEVVKQSRPAKPVKPVNKISVVETKGDIAKTPVKKSTPVRAKQANTGTYKLESVMNERAWVRSPDGTIRSYSVGDRLPNGKSIGNVESNGVFDQSGKLILSR